MIQFLCFKIIIHRNVESSFVLMMCTWASLNPFPSTWSIVLFCTLLIHLTNTSKPLRHWLKYYIAYLCLIWESICSVWPLCGWPSLSGCKVLTLQQIIKGISTSRSLIADRLHTTSGAAISFCLWHFENVKLMTGDCINTSNGQTMGVK